MTIESKITTDQELQDGGFEFSSFYQTPREDYEVYVSSDRRLVVERPTNGLRLWVIQNDRRGVN